jgi:hypothetical protein
MSVLDRTRPLPVPRQAPAESSWLRENGLSLTLLALFLICLAGQAMAGWLAYREEAQAHGYPMLGLLPYLGSGHFLEAVFENWESEFLQMGAYVILTSFLFQKGSSESKKPDEENPQDQDPRAHAGDPGAPALVRQGGWKLRLYEHSLSLALAAFFLLSFAGHALAGAREYRLEQVAHGEPAPGLLEYVSSSRFWFESLQNWQSEFLAVFALVVLSIFLRQRGSPESKPVAAPHAETGSE